MTTLSLDIICMLKNQESVENILIESDKTIGDLEGILVTRIRFTHPHEKFLNYGFVCHCNKEICGNFIPNSTELNSLPMDIFNGTYSGLMFLFKSSFRNLTHRNKKKKLVFSVFKKNYNSHKYQKKLTHSIIEQNVLKVASLLNKGVDPNFIDSESSMPPIFHVMQFGKGHQDIILELLTKYGAHVDFKSSSGSTAIHYAVALGSFYNIQLLIKFGANLNGLNEKGEPAWFQVINPDQTLEFFRWIMLSDADLRMKNAEEQTVLHILAKEGMVTHLEIFLDSCMMKYSKEDFETIINSQNKLGDTALHTSILNKRLDCSILLIEKGCNANIQNCFGYTPETLANKFNDLNFLSLFENPKGFSAKGIKYIFDKAIDYPVNQTCLSERIPFGFGLISAPVNTIKTYTFKKYGKSSCLRMINNFYPPVLQATSSHYPKFCEQLQLRPGEIVQVFLITNNGVAFGRKQSLEVEYGWFPTAAVGLDNQKSHMAFQAQYSIRNNQSKLPSFHEIDYYGFVPVIVNIPISGANMQLGLQISYSSQNFSRSLVDSYNPLLISPHYIRSFREYSMAREYDLRIGDRILMIHDIDVTNAPHKDISLIIRGIISGKVFCKGKQKKGKKFATMNGFGAHSMNLSQNSLTFLVARYHVSGKNREINNQQISPYEICDLSKKSTIRSRDQPRISLPDSSQYDENSLDDVKYEFVNPQEFQRNPSFNKSASSIISDSIYPELR